MRIYTRRRIVYRIVGACLFAQKLWLGLRTLVGGGAESLDSLSSFAALLLLVGNIVYKVKVEKKKRGVGTAEPIVKQYRNDFVRVLGPYDLLELSVLNI